ncbi:MAG: hypothetical protein ACI8P0_005983 [Planctomycetaceae bacterium]|jgi:hypothetical protein
MSERRGSFGLVLAGVAVIAIVVVGVALLLNPEEPTTGSTSGGGNPPDVDEKAETPAVVLEAQKLQQASQWCEARDAWQQVIEEFKDSREGTVWSTLASRNLDLVKERCEPPKNLIPAETRVEVPRLPESERPAPVSEERLLAAYPTGRSVRGVSDLQITGEGSNRDWGLQGSCSFRYLARVAVEATVESNDGRELTFLVHYPEVSQSLVLTNKTLELAPIEMPLLSIVWENSEIETVLRHIPGYLIIRDLTNVAKVIDPRLKRTLTALADQFDIQPGDEFELQANLGKLDGSRFRMTYRSGLGVTWIEDLDSGLFTPDELIRIAYSSSLLMDQYLVPTAEKQVGDEWTVRVQDVASLLHLDGMAQTSGELRLRREESPANSQHWSLGVRSGDIDVSISDTETEQEAHADIRSGVIHYDIARQVVLDAKLTLDATSDWSTRDHLLFGAEDLKDVEIKAFYRGERLDVPEAEAAP